MFGPENRNVGGVADLIIDKYGSPFAHVEYKSNDGEPFVSAFAQGKKYTYLHSSLKIEDLFGIYGKGENVSFFIIKEHWHTSNGYSLKGPMYDGMFCLYVDLEEQVIKILPQQNNYFPQYIAYNLSESEGYLRAECISTFMSIHETVPDVDYNPETNRVTFESGVYKKAPVQLFYNKQADSFKVTFVDTLGKISCSDSLDFKIALQFVHRPSQILTEDFVHNRFKPAINSI